MNTEITMTSTVEVMVETPSASLAGILTIPAGAEGIVVFAHGSGSTRLGSRNQFVAKGLNDRGLATLLFDLLTPGEEAVDLQTHQFRVNISLLARRLIGVVDWLVAHAEVRGRRIGLFGSSTGAAAALMAAAQRPREVKAVVSRGGRPDLAHEDLSDVVAPTLFLVGGLDHGVIMLNEEARARMNGAKVKIEVVPGASHLFAEPGALDKVSRLACDWFQSQFELEGPEV